MKPDYYAAPPETDCAEWFTYLQGLPWEDHTPVRRECFMSALGPVTYTYGSGRGERTYTSIPISEAVDRIRKIGINAFLGVRMNVCFLNFYRGERDHLGWHADDHPGTDHTQPICVVSFGAAREIWWRKKGETGVVPPEQRRLLEAGSMFVMPPGFQQEYEHRIPKADRVIGPRISLTFRCFLDTPQARDLGLP